MSPVPVTTCRPYGAVKNALRGFYRHASLTGLIGGSSHQTCVTFIFLRIDIDRIVEYGDIGFPGTEKVINPAWQE